MPLYRAYFHEQKEYSVTFEADSQEEADSLAEQIADCPDLVTMGYTDTEGMYTEGAELSPQQDSDPDISEYDLKVLMEIVNG